MQCKCEEINESKLRSWKKPCGTAVHGKLWSTHIERCKTRKKIPKHHIWQFLFIKMSRLWRDAEKHWFVYLIIEKQVFCLNSRSSKNFSVGLIHRILYSVHQYCPERQRESEPQIYLQNSYLHCYCTPLYNCCYKIS